MAFKVGGGGSSGFLQGGELGFGTIGYGYFGTLVEEGEGYGSTQASGSSGD